MGVGHASRISNQHRDRERISWPFFEKCEEFARYSRPRVLFPTFFGKSSRQFPKTSTRFASGLPRETNLLVQFAGLTQWDSRANLENKSRRKFDRRR